MKKQEKIEVIEQAINNTEILRCYFSYDQSFYHYYYPIAVNDKLLLAVEEDDFILDGYAIRKLSHLKLAEIKDDKCNEINKALGLTDGIVDPKIDISSFESIFKSLMTLNKTVIIEDEINGDLAIGKIKKVYKNRLSLLEFGSDGSWCDEETVIPYSLITTVKWNTRYTNVWSDYLKINR